MVILSKSVKSRPRLKIAVYLDEPVLDKGSELIITIEPTAPVKSLYMRIMDETSHGLADRPNSSGLSSILPTGARNWWSHWKQIIHDRSIHKYKIQTYWHGHV